jgi:hypothetical protein
MSITQKQTDFINYIVNLAPTKETALFIRQKPIYEEGEIQLHADKSIKCTWPAYLPSTINMKEGEAWYGNTGSYILDRFQNGAVSASANNCSHVLVMMLDDVGDPSKTRKIPNLSPTWVMETSQDSFQWGYAFSVLPTKEAYTAAIKAIAAAGYCDTGATNATRNFRLPGSTNLKTGKNAWVSKLTKFSPEVKYTLTEICDRLEVTPLEEEKTHYNILQINDVSEDDVVAWLNNEGLVISRVNPAGWMGVVCPNHEQHTDGNSEGRYKPVDRSYCCLHSHCTHLDSQTFLDWVAKNGGPAHKSGIRHDLLTKTISNSFSSLTPLENVENSIFNETAEDVIASVELKELGRVEKADWYKNFAYLESEDGYFSLKYKREISRAAFNATFSHLECNSIHGKNAKLRPSYCFDENREGAGGKILSGLTYAAGDPVIVSIDGNLYGNRWIDARPKVSQSLPDKNIRLWLDHCKTLVPNASELEHILDVMAFKLQNPRTKINHAILHGGEEGCGKDTMWAPFIWAVCGEGLKNRALMDSNITHGQWGYHFESEIIIINELKEPDAAARRQLANQLKAVIAAPPETLSVNRKGKHPYDVANRVFVLAFSNEQVPISLATQDRRWFCVWSHAPKMDPNDGKVIWEWFKKDGYPAIAYFLSTRDVSKFNPAAAPAMTEFKANLIVNSMSSAESYLLEMIMNREGEFSKGVIGAPFAKLCANLSLGAPNGIKIPTSALLHALKEAKWVDCGRIYSRDFVTPKQAFCAPDLSNLSKSELRRIIENPRRLAVA